MALHEMQSKRDKMEKDIMQAIRTFEAETGMVVTNLYPKYGARTIGQPENITNIESLVVLP